MEIRYKIMVYIAIAVFAALFILIFVPLKKNKGKLKKGKKVANTFYVKEESFYKRKIAAYKVLTFMMVLMCTLSIVMACFMMGRPYRTETVEEENYRRDIILCIDISSSVDSLNAHLIDDLKDIVENMQGERFGLVIFNTSPVLLVPLTDDYQYIIDELNVIQEKLEERWNSGFSFESDYITSGTQIGSEYRGSSLIGDGLASAVFDFQDLEEEADRTRLIIFSTDNELNGTPFVTLKEASDLCVKHNVQAYGIGVRDMNKKRRIEMQEAMENTGGKFYEYGISGDCAAIVTDIERETKTYVNKEPKVEEIEVLRAPFIILLGCTAAMMVFTKLAKH